MSPYKMSLKLDAGEYFGTTSELYRRDGLTVAETVFPAGLTIPPHEHENAFFCFVMEGRGTRSWQGRTGAERPMGLTVFPSAIPHANRWYECEGRAMHVEFGKHWLERLRGVSHVLERPADFERGPPVWLAKRLIAECHQQDDVTPLVVEGLVLEMLAECSRAPAGPNLASVPAWLARALCIMRERFAEKLTLDDIAAECAVSADYLARLFRHHQGFTVGEYLRKLRVDFACQRLSDSKATLAEIALAAGFTDQSHFTRVFQNHMRVTPRKYRALQKGGRFLPKS